MEEEEDEEEEEEESAGGFGDPQRQCRLVAWRHRVGHQCPCLHPDQECLAAPPRSASPARGPGQQRLAEPQLRSQWDGGEGWHKALVVGSVTLWRRLWPLALEPSAMTSRHPHCCGHLHCLGGNPECNFCPWRPPLMA